jgi:hypothetical protein
MKQTIITVLLLIGLSTHAQTTQQDSLLIKAGRQATTALTLPLIIPIVTAPMLTNFQDPNIIIAYAGLNALSLTISYVLHISAWSNIRKAGKAGRLNKNQTGTAKIPE